MDNHGDSLSFDGGVTSLEHGDSDDDATWIECSRNGADARIGATTRRSHSDGCVQTASID